MEMELSEVSFGDCIDPGPLGNDPLVSALSEAATAFPLSEDPDFILSLGTGEPEAPGGDTSADVSRSVLKNGALPRLCRLIWEKMRDKKIRQIFETHPRYHRLDFKFDGPEPRLDDTSSMSELTSKVQADHTLSNAVRNIARCMIASLFYFKLDSLPERVKGKHVGTGRIQCVVRRSNPAFRPLLDQLSRRSAVFYANGEPVLGESDDRI